MMVMTIALFFDVPDWRVSATRGMSRRSAQCDTGIMHCRI